MKRSDIKVGFSYRGKSGEVRRVLGIAGENVRFEVLAKPTKGYLPNWQVGSRSTVLWQTFAAWAQAEVASLPEVVGVAS